MTRITPIAAALAVCVLSATSADAASMVINGFTTSTGNLDGNLTGFSTAAGDFTINEFATATGPNENNIVFLEGSTPPANSTDALSDQRIDTGQLSVGQNTVLNVAGPLSASDTFFVFFNGGGGNFFQGPGLITAVDAGGAALGSATVNVSDVVAMGDPNIAGQGPNDVIELADQLLLYEADRIGSSVLSNRVLAGATVDIADFNIADLSVVAGFTIAGEVADNAFLGSFDINTVGIAENAIPEPTAAALLGLTALGLVARRQR